MVQAHKRDALRPIPSSDLMLDAPSQTQIVTVKALLKKTARINEKVKEWLKSLFKFP